MYIVKHIFWGVNMHTIDDRLKDEFIMATMNDLVPQDHLVRKILRTVDFSFIYELTKTFYSNIGRPSIDPVVLFKIPILKSLFGISSIRKTCEEINVNVAYRLFMNLPFSMNVPEHSTYSKNYTQRFMNTDIYQQIFTNILNQIIEHDLIDFTNINIDSTNIKASANKKKFIDKVVNKEKSVFEDEMLAVINDKRKDDDDKPLPPANKIATKRQKESTTDQDAGWLNKSEKEKNFSYNAHTVCDKRGYVIDSVIKPSNMHDSKVFPELYEKLVTLYKDQIVSIALDAGYYSGPLIKRILDQHHLPLLPYKRPMAKKNYEIYKYLKFDEINNQYVHNDGSIYRYVNVNRQGYLTYRTPLKPDLRVSIYKPYFDYVKDLRLTTYGKQIYALRKQTIERVFADLKERHHGRYTHYRGIKKVSDHSLLIFASMNMKKMANFLTKNVVLSSFLSNLITFFQRKRQILQPT